MWGGKGKMERNQQGEGGSERGRETLGERFRERENQEEEESGRGSER